MCHSDLHVIKGEVPMVMPTVMGHEGAGIVEKVGPGVDALQPGDHVVMLTISCGKCRYYLAGRTTQCVEKMPVRMAGALPGGGIRLHKGDRQLHHLHGLASFAEYSVVHERMAIKVRQDAPMQVLCLMGCGASTGVGAVLNTACLRPGESIVIYGCGGVGMSAVMGAKLAGAGKIIAVDMVDGRLEMATELGADYAVNPSREDPQHRTVEITGGGADYALDCTGSPNVINQAFGSIHTGGTCILVGLAPLGSVVNIAPYEFLMGKTLTGSIQGGMNAFVDVPRYVDLFMDGKLPIDKLITKVYTLDEINDAFAALERGEGLRSVIRF